MFYHFFKISLAALILTCAYANAAVPAGHVQVSGSNLTDSTGLTVANATINFTPVNNAGVPLSYRVGSGGQSTNTPVSAQVTNGAFSINLADTSLTLPVNVCYSVSVIDNVSGQSLMGSGYTCVQPSASGPSVTGANAWCTSGGVCNFDTFAPNVSALLTSIPWSTAPLVIGTVTTLPQGASPTVTLSGAAAQQALNFGIPTGPTGPTGPPTSIAIGTVTTNASGVAGASMSGAAPNQSLNLSLPIGPQGVVGPQGIQGITGPQGIQGFQGTGGSTGPVGPPGTPSQFIGAWSSSITYVVGQVVSFGGANYVALVGNTNVTPAVGATWGATSGIAGSVAITPSGTQQVAQPGNSQLGTNRLALSPSGQFRGNELAESSIPTPNSLMNLVPARLTDVINKCSLGMPVTFLEIGTSIEQGWEQGIPQGLIDLCGSYPGQFSWWGGDLSAFLAQAGWQIQYAPSLGESDNFGSIDYNSIPYSFIIKPGSSNVSLVYNTDVDGDPAGVVTIDGVAQAAINYSASSLATITYNNRADYSIDPTQAHTLTVYPGATGKKAYVVGSLTSANANGSNSGVLVMRAAQSGTALGNLTGSLLHATGTTSTFVTAIDGVPVSASNFTFNAGAHTLTVASTANITTANPQVIEYGNRNGNDEVIIPTSVAGSLLTANFIHNHTLATYIEPQSLLPSGTKYTGTPTCTVSGGTALTPATVSCSIDPTTGSIVPVLTNRGSYVCGSTSCGATANLTVSMSGATTTGTTAAFAPILAPFINFTNSGVNAVQELDVNTSIDQLGGLGTQLLPATQSMLTPRYRYDRGLYQ